ncbi:MAG: guanylate kinase [Clostridiales bacterium]
MAKFVVMQTEQGLLIVVSGPSGVGKGRVCAELLRMDANTLFSVSATTRTPRDGEKDGESYFFLTPTEFMAKRDRGEFLEWAEVFGNYYGTLKSEVDRRLSAGKNIILEIDIQGAMQIKAACPDAVYVFILPPSMKELENRIRLRGSETEQSLQLRLSKAAGEIAWKDRYDYQIVNHDVESSAKQLYALIAARRRYEN